MKSVMTPQQHFSQIAKPKIQRSTFDRSHGLKTTFDAGLLIPIFWDEALPGDTFNLNATIFGRLATLQKPIMDNLFADVHFWSVPERILWSNWQRFNGEQDNPGDSTDFILPVMSPSPATVGWGEQSLPDYFGLPTKIPAISGVRADVIRAYKTIWNQWYRDENLQDALEISLGDGPDTYSTDPEDATRTVIMPRGRRKDYFTGALPFAQKSEPVSIPLGTSAPVLGIGKATSAFVTGPINNIRESDGVQRSYAAAASINYDAAAGAGEYTVRENPDHTGYPGIYADLSEASTITINALREASQIQVMYELDARGGTRYTEILRAHFGVISPDARLQRPEFLGGFTQAINVNPIAQTAPTADGQTPQGNLAAMGTVSRSQKGFIKSFVEHEIVIGLISVRADMTYQQGLFRPWTRSTRFDFYWPSFANLGEQSILNKEIYCQGSSTPDNAVFGYQERYAEYRYKPSQITGLFRSNATQSLDVWHLSPEFATLPTLAGIIPEVPPLGRVVAVDSQPDFLLDVFFDYKCARPMPTYAIPGSIVNRF